MEILVRNANDMFSEIFWMLKAVGVRAESRNGPVIRLREPALTRLKNPMERVLFHPERDANPIFHLMEAIWMLAGRRDVAFVQQFNSKIGQYSDDGEVFNAAYGYRWRYHFGTDQLKDVVRLLREDPDTRQAVVQMWDAKDLSKTTKDKACNTQLIFEIVNNHLNMMVINRSNDAWYGYAGANVVHFTILQEFVAAAVGVLMGEYRTFSTNLHLYTEMYDAEKYVDNPPFANSYDKYDCGPLFAPSSLGVTPDNWEDWLMNAESFCASPFSLPTYNYGFFNDTALPMAMVSKIRRQKSGTGKEYTDVIEAQDWRFATQQWIARREETL